MHLFPLLSKFGRRKPYNELPAVEGAMERAVSLSDLEMSAVQAEKAGYILAIKPVSKRRAGVWVKKNNLEYFQLAEQAIRDTMAASEALRDQLIQGKLEDSADDITRQALKEAQQVYDPSHHLDLMTAVQLRFQGMYKILSQVLDYIEGQGELIQDTSELQQAMVEYHDSLKAYQSRMEEALSEELKQASLDYNSFEEAVAQAVRSETFLDDFLGWMDHEGLPLTVKTIISRAAEYVVDEVSRNSGLNLHHPLLNRYQQAVQSLESSLDVQAFLESLVASLEDYNSQGLGHLYLVAAGVRGTTPVEGEEDLPRAPRIQLKLSAALQLKPLVRQYEQQYALLEQGQDFSFEYSIDIHRRGDWDLAINTRFQFKTPLQNYRGHYKLENHSKDTYKGIFSHRKTKGLMIQLEKEDLHNLGAFSLFQSLVRQSQMPSADGLLKKFEKFRATCLFFIQQNEDKEGFTTFAERHGSFACSSVKQAKNFKSILEKRYADFTLAQLSTNHADIFSGREGRRLRRVIFFAGPTNSGKSYMAFEELARHETGVYLGPLRLLALEGVEELQKRGKIVSLITGEERDIVEGASHLSQTIETFDREAQYDCAIIDEIQMIADKGRGGAFMEALLNINADTLVLTGSDNAVDVLQEICSRTGDLFEVRYLERKNPLKWVGEFSLPRRVDPDMKGTAVVAFNKKSIHIIRNNLLQRGYTVSVIYGALSPDVRRAEAERFRSGETDFLVATDAIGMGLNLPIKRVLFSQSDKFDGETIRDLEGTEVLQIGGRAGRYGIFQEAGEVGIVLGLTRFPVDEAVIKEGFYGSLDKIKGVYVSITYKQLFDSYNILNSELSSMIQTLAAKNKYTWQRAKQAHVVDSERFNKAIILQNAATLVASELGLDKTGTKALRKMDIPFSIIFKLLNTPFDADRHGELLEVSFQNVLRVVMQQEPKTQWVNVNTSPIKGSYALERAETEIKGLTLHYYFASFFDSFGSSPYELTTDEILLLRKEIGIQISNYLAKNEAMEGVAGPTFKKRGEESRGRQRFHEKSHSRGGSKPGNRQGGGRRSGNKKRRRR